MKIVEPEIARHFDALADYAAMLDAEREADEATVRAGEHRREAERWREALVARYNLGEGDYIDATGEIHRAIRRDATVTTREMVVDEMEQMVPAYDGHTVVTVLAGTPITVRQSGVRVEIGEGQEHDFRGHAYLRSDWRASVTLQIYGEVTDEVDPNQLPGPVAGAERWLKGR